MKQCVLLTYKLTSDIIMWKVRDILQIEFAYTKYLPIHAARILIRAVFLRRYFFQKQSSFLHSSCDIIKNWQIEQKIWKHGKERKRKDETENMASFAGNAGTRDLR